MERLRQAVAGGARPRRMEWVLVPYLLPIGKAPQRGAFSLWCGRQDSNLHAHALEPKSNESTNSTTPAYSFVPLILHGEVSEVGHFA